MPRPARQQFPHATPRPWFVYGSVNGLILIKSRVEPIVDIGFTAHNGGLPILEAEHNAAMMVFAVNKLFGAAGRSAQL